MNPRTYPSVTTSAKVGASSCSGGVRPSSSPHLYTTDADRITHHIMESAGAPSPPVQVEEQVQQHATMLQHLGRAMDRVLINMERWERGGFPTTPSTSLQPTPPPTPQPTPLSTLLSPGPSGIWLSLPSAYDGTVAGCQGFLLQLELYLATVHPARSGY